MSAAAKPMHPKAKEASVKEGGKKGQDLVGMSEMGGMSYFCIALETCKGNKELLEAAMEGANKEVDEGADDRKGGAGKLGKMFLSAGDASLMILGHCPKDNQDKLTLKEWAETLAKAVDGDIKDITEDTCFIEAAANPEKEQFPLKMREAAINASFALLREKGLVVDDDSDDDFGEMAEQAGIEW
jgi:hypothetical protein